MNSIYGNNNPRVHDHTVSVVVDACAYADDAVIHVNFSISDQTALHYVHCMSTIFTAQKSEILKIM